MQRFHNILVVCHGLGQEHDILKFALQLADRNKARLSILVVCPSFPQTFQDYKTSHEQSITSKIKDDIAVIKASLHLDDKHLPVHIEVDYGKNPDIRMIRYVLQHAHDLLIKNVDLNEPSSKGFKAIDMGLLRKCPCALFLYRPLKHKAQDVRIAVAVDPEDQEPHGKNLAINLLQISSSLAHSYHSELHVISCWSHELEDYLRGSVFIKISEEELSQRVKDKESSHYKSLTDFIQQAKINNHYKINHLKGSPDAMIPSFIKKHKVDILIMGTVARTGISGFLIGNTAENILQEVDCSLMALKPPGFVSPIQAY